MGRVGRPSKLATARKTAWQSVRTSPASGRNESRDTSHSLQKLFDRSSDNVRMEQGFALETSCVCSTVLLLLTLFVYILQTQAVFEAVETECHLSLIDFV